MSLLHNLLVIIFVCYHVEIGAAQSPPCTPESPGCNDPYPPGRQDIGDSWWAIGDASFNVFLTSVSTFLQLPEPPQGSPGVITLNPALDNSNTSAGSVPVDQSYEILAAVFPMEACNQTSDQWCMFGSFFNGSQDSSLPGCETTGPPINVDAGTMVNVTYIYRPENNTLSEFIARQGFLEKVATNIVSSIQPFQFWPRTECLCEAQGTILQHTYHQTTITLSKSVPDFNTSARGNNTNNPSVYSSDGGLTWHIDTLVLEESLCDNQVQCDTAATIDTCPWDLSVPIPPDIIQK